MVSSNICRCCLSEACYKDISNEYIHRGLKEVYAEMLLDTFCLNISHQNSDSRLICEDCIVRLRDAAAFKKQVIQVEEIITKGITNGGLKNDDTKPLDQPDDFIDYITGEFENDSTECDDEVKHPINDDVNNQRSYDDDDDDGFNWGDNSFTDDFDGENTFILKVDPEDNIPLQLLQKSCTSKKTSSNNSTKRVKKGKAAAKNKKEIKKKTTSEKRIKKQPEMSDRKQNSLNLVTNSNICLFESLKTKFRCFYCKNSYISMKDLREHSSSHSDEKRLKYSINRHIGMSFKCADISNLACKICSESLKDLSDLQTHLTEKHEIKFSGDDNVFVQYRLVDGFQCVLCDQEFQSFYKLSVHMNSHYKYHVCEVCGSSFINRLSLRVHVQMRHTELKCALCTATFSHSYLRVKHMRKVQYCIQYEKYNKKLLISTTFDTLMALLVF
ncbi:zinc-finger associated domain (zf-AD) domain-containing protein [Phthorimaea operculella]|nr:zinc-finger associated domain (zf-AD) domain-containing protein [Phthorimaea operculella]